MGVGIGIGDGVWPMGVAVGVGDGVMVFLPDAGLNRMD